MQKIWIKNFGPITNCVLEINDFMLFIGEQASGKSTICKCIYFFKAMRDDVFSYLVESINDRNFDRIPRVLNKRNRRRFLDFFGASRHLENVRLKYEFMPGYYAEISLSDNDKNVTTNYSQEMLQKLKEIEERAKRFSDDIYQESDNLGNLHIFEKRTFYQYLRAELNSIFADDKELVYIPAGRSLLSLLSDQLSTISLNNLDYFTSQFLRIIQEEKVNFKDGIDEIIQRKKHTTVEPIDKHLVNLAKSIMHQILKGEYRNDASGEKIVLDKQPNKFVKINYASSGQHESVWILNLIFSWLLNQKKMFVVIEEPEAHLFPVAQRDLVNLIALLSNQNKNQVMITTHSPYILTSVNNLLYANKVGKSRNKAVDKIINQSYWLQSEKTSAYLLGDSNTPCPLSIIEPETGLVRAEEIDSISNVINGEYQSVYNLED